MQFLPHKKPPKPAVVPVFDEAKVQIIDAFWFPDGRRRKDGRRTVRDMGNVSVFTAEEQGTGGNY
jgi:hypothetical protein